MIARREKSVHRLKRDSLYQSIRKEHLQTATRLPSRLKVNRRRPVPRPEETTKQCSYPETRAEWRGARRWRGDDALVEVRRGGACTPVNRPAGGRSAASSFPATRTAPPAGGFGSVRQALLRVSLAGLANSPVPQSSFDLQRARHIVPLRQKTQEAIATAGAVVCAVRRLPEWRHPRRRLWFRHCLYQDRRTRNA